MGKPKGMRQILWERGFIDESKPNGYYTKFGTCDEAKNWIPESSYDYLLSQLTDFVNEKSLLQYYCEQLGVVVERSPKCHPEIAGMGIEYTWGYIKNAYRRLSRKNKKNKQAFLKSLEFVMSREKLPTDQVRKFCRRARRYMLAYVTLAKADMDEVNNFLGIDVSKWDANQDRSAPIKVEKLTKEMKNHRCAYDFDKGFIHEMTRQAAEGNQTA